MAGFAPLQPIPIRSARLRLDSPRVAVHIHHDARQVLQRLPQLGRVLGDVGNLFHLQQRPNAQARLARRSIQVMRDRSMLHAN